MDYNRSIYISKVVKTHFLQELISRFIFDKEVKIKRHNMILSVTKKFKSQCKVYITIHCEKVLVFYSSKV